MVRSFWTKVAAPIALAAVMVAACGGDAEDEPEEDATSNTTAAKAEGAVSDDCKTSELLNTLADLSAEERETELTELAAEENGMTIYSSMDAEDLDTVVQAFRKEYNIGEVTQFSSNPEATHQRFGQEVQAGRSEVDVYENNSSLLQTVANEGLLAEYASPHRENLTEAAAVSPFWVGNRFNIYVVGWNTNLVKEDELPEDIRGFADAEWKGRVSITSGNFDWYQAVFTWLKDEEKMSDEEIDEFFTALASNATVYDRNPLVTELTALGEIDLSVHHLQHIINRQVAGDADVPLAWEPVVEPVVVRPNAHAIPCGAPHPATAILFADWLISAKGQEEVIVGELNREPTNTDAEGGQIDPTKYTVLSVDVEAMSEDAAKWSDEWSKYVQMGAAGGKG